MAKLQDIQKMNLSVKPVSNQLGQNAKTPTSPTKTILTLPNNQVNSNITTQKSFKAPTITPPTNLNTKGISVTPYAPDLPTGVTVNKGKITGTGITSPTPIISKTPVKDSTPIINTTSTTVKPDYDTQTGMLTPEGKAKGLPEVNAKAPVVSTWQNFTPTIQQNTPTSNTPTVDTSRAGLLTTLTNKGTQTGSEYQAINDLLTKKREELKNLDIGQATQEGAIETQPGEQNVQLGYLGAQQRINAIKREKLAEEITGLTNQLGAANTQQQTQTGAIQNALGQQQPMMQFGQLTNPGTGMPMSGGMYGSNPQLQTAVQQAVALAQKVGTQSPDVQNMIRTFDMPGQVEFQRQMAIASGGNYNPSALNTQVETSMGIGSDLQKQGAQLSTNMGQFEAVAPQVVNFLDSTGINNSNSPWVNKTIKDYIQKNMSADNAAIVNSMFNELKLTSSQILGRGGQLTPTEVTDMVNNADLSTLSPAQLNTYITAIKNLGNTTLKNIQDKQTEAYGTSGGYGGTPAVTGQPYQYGTNLSPTETATGTAVGLIPTALGAIGGSKALAGLSGFFGKIFK